MVTIDNIAKVQQVLFMTVDPTVPFRGSHLPAMTTLLHRVCDNDPTKFEEASRIVELFIKAALSPATNTLVVIGWLGDRTAYVNVPREEAIDRYRKSRGMEPDELLESRLISESFFTDELWAYDVSGPLDKLPEV